MAVALDGDAILDTALDTLQCPADEFHTTAVIRGGDTVFGNDEIALEFLMDCTDHIG